MADTAEFLLNKGLFWTRRIAAGAGTAVMTASSLRPKLNSGFVKLFYINKLRTVMGC